MIRKVIRAEIAVALLLSTAAAASAAPICSTTGDGTGLARIDTVTGIGNLVGSFAPAEFCYSLAVDRRETIYVVCGDSLYTADRATGSLSHVADLSVSGAVFYGMEFDAAGQLWSASFDANLYKIDKTTGVATVVGPMVGTTPVSDPMDLAFDPTGTLYLVAGEVPASLFTIDTATGAATLVGVISGDVPIMGITFDANGTLFGISYAADGRLYTIDPATAVATPVGGPTGLYLPHNAAICPAQPAAAAAMSTAAMAALGVVLGLIGLWRIRLLRARR